VFRLRNRHGVGVVQQASTSPLVNGRYRPVSNNPRPRPNTGNAALGRHPGITRPMAAARAEILSAKVLAVSRLAQDNTRVTPPLSGTVW